MEELPKLPGLEDLPTLVLEKLVEFLDYSSRRTCRLVSKNLKCYVDDIGLSVRIDSREPGISNFCQSLTATEVQILYLKEFDLDPQLLKKWKTAILSGPIDTTWLNNGLQRNCSNLRVLILNGECLVSQDFSGPVDLLPVFQHLLQLQCSLSTDMFSKAVGKVGLLLNIQGAALLQTYKKMDARVQKNMTYLMRTIRSRVLKTFYAFVSVNILQQDKTRKVRWEHEPLFEFFQDHRHTLEELLLPSLFSREAYLEGKAYDIPSNLKMFCWTPGFEEKFVTYWKSLLLAQNSLQKLCLNSLKVPGNMFLPLLNSVSSNNARTLKCIQLSFEDVELSLDMKMFQCCDLLESFNMEAGSKIFIRNLNYLPRARLTSLKLMEKVDIESDFDGVQFMQGFSPKFLDLGAVSSRGQFNDPKYMFHFIKLVLRSRNLNSFVIMMKPDNLPPAWSLFKMAELNENGLQMWLANLQAPEPANHRCMNLMILDNRTLPAPDKQKLKSDSNHGKDLEYVEAEAALNLDYMELISRLELSQAREQPFNISRNADSYTIHTNMRTKEYRVLANKKSYTQRVNNIEDRVRVVINFVMDGGNGNTEFRPLSFKNFLVKETGKTYYKVVGNNNMHKI